MKKLILLSLVASIASTAATTGYIKSFNENETTIMEVDNKTAHKKLSDYIKQTKSTFGLETEVKVADSGFSFGANMKAKDLYLLTDLIRDYAKSTDEPNITNTFEGVKDIVRNESSVWAKYELPEVMNFNSYVKGIYATKGESTFEADANYKVADNVKIGLNTMTKINFTDATVDGDKVTSTHKIYAKGDYMMIKDIDAELGLKHDWKADSKTNNKSLKEVFLKAKTSYEVMKDLKLTGEVKFNHILGDAKTFETENFLPKGFMEIDESKEVEAIYQQTYTLSANYTGLKDFELFAKAFIQHLHMKEEGKGSTYKAEENINYGIMPEITYKGFKNLTLSSKNLLSAITNINVDMTEAQDADKYTTSTHALLLFNAMAEYNYMATEKLSIKPSADASLAISIDKDNTFDILKLTPAVNVEYKANDNLTFTSGLKSTSSFEDGTYTNTKLKTNLEIKYTW